MIKSVRGMHDILPATSKHWSTLEQILATLAANYNCQQIRTPIVESLDLFVHSLGDTTDIVAKEMYQFADGEHLLALRPENTAGCVRSAIEHNLVNRGQTQRLWYLGPMFRRERPQAGRYRQFHQFGVEVFGYPQPVVDAEVIALSAQLWQLLGLQPRLELNSIGNADTRVRYRQALIDFLAPKAQALLPHQRARLQDNPLRILDAKDEQSKQALIGAPELADFLDANDAAHFAQVCECLDQLGIAYTLNQNLVRGLDYYNRTVFEWVSDDLGAQATICAGGRYDGLVSQFGGEHVPGIGFALGLERLLLLLQQQGWQADICDKSDVYIISSCSDQITLQITTQVRAILAEKKVSVDWGARNWNKQFKKANASGATLAIILGDDEYQQGVVAVKPLRAAVGQKTIALNALHDELPRLFAELLSLNL